MFKRNQSGFTMIELMIVVVLITILAGLAIVDLSSHSGRLKLRSQAHDILSNLRLARSMAVANKTPHGVFFDADGRKFIVFQDRVNLANHTFDVGDSLIYTQDLENTVDYDVCSFPNNTVVFKADGSASSSGSVGLLSLATDGSFTVDVLASTGRVRLTQS